LEQLGYAFFLDGENIKCELNPEYYPGEKNVKKLIKIVKDNKSLVYKEVKKFNAMPDYFIIKTDLLDGEKIFFRKNINIEIPSKYNDLVNYTYFEAYSLKHANIKKADLKEYHFSKKISDQIKIERS